MKDCLDELKPNSLWFLKVASKRFAELIEEIPDVNKRLSPRPTLDKLG